MLKLKYLFIAVLFVCASCKDGESETTTPAPAPGAENVKPIAATFPDAVFTDVSTVQKGTASLTILDRLIALINATPEGEAIHLNIFLFDYQPLVQAVKDANTRGVKMHVMMDLSRQESHETNPMTMTELRRPLEAKGGEVISVVNDASTSAINHNKFALFTKVKTTGGVVENLVFQTSHNFTPDDARKYQDALTIADAGLYGAYKTYWTDMKAKASSGMKDYYYKEYEDATAGIVAYFMPKRRNGTSYGDDTIIGFLSSIQDPASATIKIGMSDWTKTRLNIVQKLSELQAQGAKIELVVKDKIDPEIMTGVRELQQNGATVKVFATSRNNIHAKFILIEGNWQGAPAKVLITGSHNFTQNALRNNNETMLLLKNHKLFADYSAYFESLKAVPGI
ncbi:MAG TPA: phospholipase D-like domain-containing protein [Pontibacter sp.]